MLNIVYVCIILCNVKFFSEDKRKLHEICERKVERKKR